MISFFTNRIECQNVKNNVETLLHSNITKNYPSFYIPCSHPKAHSEPSQTPKMEHLAKIFNSF